MPSEVTADQVPGRPAPVSRAVVAVLDPPLWVPPGVDPARWRRAMAEDVADLLNAMAQAQPGLAVVPADRPLADAVRWPTTRLYELAEVRVPALFAALAADGYQQAALICADAPDVPGMVLAGLLRPLSGRPMALAVTAAGTVFGLAARLPLADWVPDVRLADLDPAMLAEAAPAPGLVASVAGWHRLTGPAELARLDPALEGWEATRALLRG